MPYQTTCSSASFAVRTTSKVESTYAVFATVGKQLPAVDVHWLDFTFFDGVETQGYVCQSGGVLPGAVA